MKSHPHKVRWNPLLLSPGKRRAALHKLACIICAGMDSWKVARKAFCKMEFTGVLIHKAPVDAVFCPTCLLPLVFLNVVLDYRWLEQGEILKISWIFFFL